MHVYRCVQDEYMVGLGDVSYDCPNTFVGVHCTYIYGFLSIFGLKDL